MFIASAHLRHYLQLHRPPLCFEEDMSYSKRFIVGTASAVTPQTATASPSTSAWVWRLRQVMAEIQLSKSTIYLMISRGEFPAPVRLGSRSVGWIATEVLEWLQARVQQRAGADHDAI
jgi:prophage regulatory protein